MKKWAYKLGGSYEFKDILVYRVLEQPGLSSETKQNTKKGM